MSKPLRLSQVGLWQRQETEWIGILQEALCRLRAKSHAREDEVALNRRLFGCIVETIRARELAGVGLGTIPPTYDGPNPPIGDVVMAREFKRPDMQWILMDHQADINQSMQAFAVECKRLGSPPSPSWILNREYVLSGVRRFVLEEWSYGLNSSSGVMVGYVQDMDVGTVLAQVNSFAVAEALAPLSLVAGHPDLLELEHQLVRTFRHSPFRLRHLWVDVA